MATDILHPSVPLKPTELDGYLERGWRPTGQAIYCSDFLRTDDDELHGCLQIRLPLKNFSFKRRHRKLLNRNKRKFSTEVGPADFPDAELRRVNRLYMYKHADKTREDLEYNVVNDERTKVIDTHLFRVYDGRKLIAFSYFDVGERTMYTKSGIYDPAYASSSLGLYTMLLEIELALELGFDYYYPGYYSPTYPAFDYKLQFGPMEYRVVTTGEWIPHEGLPVDPLVENSRKLYELRDRLLDNGIQVEYREYPSFTGRFRPVRFGKNTMLDAPLLLYVRNTALPTFHSVITYDNETEMYRFDMVRSANLYDMRAQPRSLSGTPRFTTPVLVHQRILESKNPVEIFEVIGKKDRSSRP